MPEFKELARHLAVQVAANNPISVDALLSQPFYKDPAKSIKQVIADASQLLGETVLISRFVRWDTAADDGEPEPSVPSARLAKQA